MPQRYVAFWALANIKGEMLAPAATTPAFLRNSRRFMRTSRAVERIVEPGPVYETRSDRASSPRRQNDTAPRAPRSRGPARRWRLLLAPASATFPAAARFVALDARAGSAAGRSGVTSAAGLVSGARAVRRWGASLAPAARPFQRLQQEVLDLGVDATKVVRRPLLDLGVGARVDPQ